MNIIHKIQEKTLLFFLFRNKVPKQKDLNQQEIRNNPVHQDDCIF